jgi:glucokinase
MANAGYPWLVADIGGTNARFGLVHGDGAPVVDVLSFKCGDHASPQAAAGIYLEQLSRRDGNVMRPQSVALALATPISGDTVKMTNSAWTVSRGDVAAALGARRVLLLNDFEALALALPLLGDGETRWIGPERADRRWPMAVIGPGTGLGVSSCVPVPVAGGWIALAAEGGHVTAAAADDFESDVLRVLRAQVDHVSAERVLSGIGLPLLHRAVCEVRGVPFSPLDAEGITRAAREQGDAGCRTTLDTFCAMLGTFAGNVALTVGARGGVFVAGGIAQKLGDDFIASRFRERFEAKGRFAPYMARIATGLITAPHAALTGAAHALAQAGASAP